MITKIYFLLYKKYIERKLEKRYNRVILSRFDNIKDQAFNFILNFFYTEDVLIFNIWLKNQKIYRQGKIKPEYRGLIMKNYKEDFIDVGRILNIITQIKGTL